MLQFCCLSSRKEINRILRETDTHTFRLSYSCLYRECLNLTPKTYLNLTGQNVPVNLWNTSLVPSFVLFSEMKNLSLFPQVFLN